MQADPWISRFNPADMFRTGWNNTTNIAVSNGTQVIELTPEERKKFRDAMTGVYEKYCGEYMDIVRRIMTY